MRILGEKRISCQTTSGMCVLKNFVATAPFWTLSTGEKCG